MISKVPALAAVWRRLTAPRSGASEPRLDLAGYVRCVDGLWRKTIEFGAGGVLKRRTFVRLADGTFLREEAGR